MPGVTIPDRYDEDGDDHHDDYHDECDYHNYHNIMMIITRKNVIALKIITCAWNLSKDSHLDQEAPCVKQHVMLLVWKT